MATEFVQIERVLKTEAEKLRARIKAQDDAQADFFASLPDAEENLAESSIKPSFLGIAFATSQSLVARIVLAECLNLLNVKPEDFCHIIQKLKNMSNFNGQRPIF